MNFATKLLAGLSLAALLVTGCSDDDNNVIFGDVNNGGGGITEFVVIPNFDANTIAVRAINLSNGNTTHVGTANVGTGPAFVKTHPNQGFVYVANRTSGTISAFSINRATGTVTAVPGSPFTAVTSVQGLNINPGGGFLVAAGANTVQTFSIDANGALTNVSSQPLTSQTATGANAFTGGGNFWHVGTADGRLQTYNLNQTNGALTTGNITQLTGVAAQVNGIAVHNSGNVLFASGSGRVQAFSVNGAGGLTAQTSNTVTSATGLAATRGGLLYVGVQGNQIRGFNSEGSVGTLTELTGSPFTATGGAAFLGLDPTQSLLFSSNDTNSFAGNRIDGNGTLTTSTGSPFTDNLSRVFPFDFVQLAQ